MVASPDMAIAKPQVYETRRIQMTSPLLHVGSQVSKLSPFEYVQTAKRVYLPNSEALAKALLQRGRLQDYISAIENRRDIGQLLEDVFGESWWNAKDKNGDRLFPSGFSSNKWTQEQVTDLRPMIRNGMGQFYIPGSSIKGAIRTAIAYYLLKHEQEYGVARQARVSEIERKLREKLNRKELENNKHAQKFLDDKLFMDSLFSDFDLTYQGKPVPYKNCPNTDFMRAVNVSDSQPLLEKRVTNKQGREIVFNLPIVAEVVVSSRFPDGKAKHRASIYAEMVRNVRTEFTLTLDAEMLKWFKHNSDMKIPFQTVDDILNICSEFAGSLWDSEHDYWQGIQNNPNTQGKKLDFGYIKEFYEPTECPYTLRLGWGSGLLGTTVGLCLDEELVENIRDTCGIPATGFEAPKSRRTVRGSSGEIKFVPGWTKFKIASQSS